MQDGVQTYLDEAQDLLSSLEQDMLELEGNPQNQDCVNRIFRAMHTIKGSGAMFGFDEIARFTHELETAFDLVRSLQLEADKNLINIAFTSLDHISALLQAPAKGSSELTAASNGLIADLHQLIPEKSSDQASGLPTQQPPSLLTAETFWVRFIPPSNSFTSGTHPLSLLEELQELGTMRTVFHSQNIPKLDKLDPEKVYGWWDIILTSDQGQNTILDIFLFMDQESIQLFKIADQPIRTSDMDELLEMISKNNNLQEQKIFQMLLEQQKQKLAARSQPCSTQPPLTSEAIKVDANRLDALINMVGELVTIQSRLSQISERRQNDALLTQISEELERLSEEMRDVALDLRMLPIGTMFTSLRRLVRDLCRDLDKEVELVTLGAETELDKTVIDQLKDPLMHILRNSMDHGIENPSQRLAMQKERQGKIILSASHSSGEVVIKIEDDGQGIDIERVREKAISKGLISAQDKLEEKDLLQLLFAPGFSTAQKISGVSGRGVGMDVVKKSIDALRGNIDLNSSPGKGASLIIRLPLTLAIIDGMSTVISKESYIIPLSYVRACQERFITSGIKTIEAIDYMGEMIPCASLRKLLNVPGKQPEYERIIICALDGQLIGLAVDSVVGRGQTVIKSLSSVYQGLPWISGTTINGDGGISIILDIPQLIGFAAKSNV